MRSPIRDSLLALLAVVLLAGPALADDRAAAQRIAAAATTSFKLGEYARALEQYREAYRRYPAPKLLFNIGQCHRFLGDHSDAIASYEWYLRELPAAANRRLVEELIAESRASLDAQRAAPQPLVERSSVGATLGPPAIDPGPPVQREEPPGTLPLPPGPADRRATPITRTWWFWTTVSAIAIAAGGTIYVLSTRSDALPSGSLGTHDAR